MKAYGGVDVYLHIFLTSAVVGGEWSASRPCHFTPGTHWIGGWVGPRAGLDDVERRKILHSQEWNPGSLVRSLLLHRLSYPDSQLTCSTQKGGGERLKIQSNPIIFFLVININSCEIWRYVLMDLPFSGRWEMWPVCCLLRARRVVEHPRVPAVVLYVICIYKSFNKIQ
jgi:hypothetical protein